MAQFELRYRLSIRKFGEVMRSSKRFCCLSWLCAGVIALNLSGCSVYFAASGSKDPDFNKLNPGTPRPVVEEELGPATENQIRSNGEAALYTYKTGDQPAPGRAVLYLLGDILTICLAEYVFFPLEISNSGDSYQALVEYSKAGKLLSLTKIDPSQKASPFDGK